MNSWNDPAASYDSRGNTSLPEFSGPECRNVKKQRLFSKGTILISSLLIILSAVFGFGSILVLDYFNFEPEYIVSYLQPKYRQYGWKTPQTYPDIGSIPGPGEFYGNDTDNNFGKENIVPPVNSLENSETKSDMAALQRPNYPVSDAAHVVRNSSEGLEILSVGKIAENLTPSVASIVAYASHDETGAYFLGTGTIYSSDGYIITNYHVIEGCVRARVILYDGTEYEARHIASDQQADIAILKIDASGLSPVTFGISSELAIGDTVAAIGNPATIELAGTTTVGRISGPERYITVDASGNIMRLLQTDASVNPGNSGGPLINEYGQVVGIITAKLTADTYEGIGFAIASDRVEKIVNDLLEYGYVKGYPMLGITGTSVREGVYDGKNPAGVLIAEVSQLSDANEKIKEGDVVFTCNGKKVNSIYDINSIKARLEVGDTMTLGVYRNGETSEVIITLRDKHSID